MKSLKIVLTVLMLIAVALPIGAVEINAGIVGWCAFWEPSFKDSMRGENTDTFTYDREFNITPGFIGGPSVSMTFMEDWTLGAVFLASTVYAADSSYREIIPTPYQVRQVSYSLNTLRFDLDLSLGYRVNQYLTLFLGLKYIAHRGWGEVVLDTIPGSFDIEMYGNGFGAGPGLRGTLPIAGSIFATVSVSCLGERYWSLFKTRNDLAGERKSEDESFLSFIVNANAGFGYFFETMGAAIILGFRAQYGISEEGGDELLYGPTLSAMYSF